MNKKTTILVIGGAVILLCLLIIMIWIIGQIQQGDERDSESDTVDQPSNQDLPSGGDNDNISIPPPPGTESEIEDIIEPTYLTPAPPPQTEVELIEMLQAPMDYRSITIRYSTGTDSYLVYYQEDLQQAEQDLLLLLRRYGIDSLQEVSVEFTDTTQHQLPERPPEFYETEDGSPAATTWDDIE